MFHLYIARPLQIYSVVFSMGLGIGRGAESRPGFLSAAEEAIRGHGRVTQSSEGRRGAPIVIFEEIHVSRAVKVENAIALARLHDRHELRNLAVEGYLTNGPAMDWQCLRDAATDLTTLDRAEVVSQLLRNGEVGTTTALLLIYHDLLLHPTEAASEYNVELTGKAQSAMVRYLAKIAERSVRPEHLLKLSQLQQAAQNSPPEEQAAKSKAVLDYFMSLDPFTKEKYGHLSDMSRIATLSLETILNDAQEIEKRALSLSVQLGPDDQEAMKTSLAFWRGRIAANRTMADNTGLIADQTKTGLVALNLGAAHTRGVADRFSEQERPFAVVRPASLDTPGLGIDLDLESLEGIEQRASLFSEGLIADLQRIYPRDTKNSEPACNLPWVQAELELFFFARRIAGQAFSGPGSTLRTNVAAMLGFRPDQFRGRRVEVDPGQMEIVPDTGPESARVLLLRARLKSLKGSNDAVFWVKIGVVPQRLPAPSSVEALLVRCLDAIRQGPKPGRKIEDARGRVLITDTILAAFVPTKEAALKIPVSEK